MKPSGAPEAGLLGLLVVVLATVAPAGAQSRTTHAQIQLEHFLRHPDPYFIDLTLKAASKAASDPVAQALLRDAFAKRFFRGQGPDNLTIGDFARLAGACPPFGSADEKLVDLLALSGTPSAWLEPAFRRFLRERLAAADPKTEERLLDASWSGAPSSALDRYAFLVEILPSASRSSVRRRFAAERLGQATPAEMAAYHRHLDRLRRHRLARFHSGGESGTLRRLLSDRLYGLPVVEWSETGEALAPLVESSSHSSLSFFASASAALITEPASRDSGTGAVLATLAGLTEPAEAFARLQPGQDVGWFIWLHHNGVLPNLQGREMALLLASYEHLVHFAETPFEDLFPDVLRYYYGREALGERPFNEILRPQALGVEAERLLTAARRGRFFSPAHREVLARDVLGAGTSLAPAWIGNGAPSRLGLAIEIYRELPSPGASRAALTAHLDRPLLGGVVDRFLELLRLEPVPEEAVLKHLEALATHLEACRRRRAPTSRSPPLLRLENGVSADLDQAIEAVPVAPAHAGATLQPEHEVALTRFVQRLRLTMRVRGLVARALGRSPDWLPRLRRGLRQRVFGLDAAPASTLYWDEELTRFRARILLKLDDPLRTLLMEHADADEADLFFKEVYLPLVRVHGLLRILDEESGGAAPHDIWTAGPDARRNKARLEACFAALDTQRWVDADRVVLELARRYLALRHPGHSAWSVPPEDVFAGHWSVNAHLGIYRKLLGDSQPEAAGSLPQIAARVVSELEQRRRPVGPRFPIVDAAPPADVQGDLQGDAAWADNLITAAEWRVSPFSDESGHALPWQERVRPSFDDSAPFRFELFGTETSRRVDGRLRLRLGRAMLAAGVTPERLALIALFLPNHTDNLAPDSGSLEPYRRFRQEVYGRLAEQLQAVALRPGADILRRMMRLHVAQRNGPRLEPDFEDLFASFRARAQDRHGVETALSHLRLEQSELERILEGRNVADLEAARVYIDENLPKLLPPGWSPGNAVLLARYFRRELRALDEEKIFWFLRLRRQLRVVANGLGHPGAEPSDLHRLARAFELVDANLWISRPDFEPKHYLELQREDPDRWWPALVILGWYDADLAAQVIEALGTVVEPSVDRRELETSLKRRVLQLNEAAFATLRALAEHADAEPMLTFEHRIPMRLLDLRLLAEARVWEEASAGSLARDGFVGMLASFELARRGRPPSDEELWQRLFVSLDFALPEMERRAVDLSVHLDGVVRLADVWSRKPGLPVHLRQAARVFMHGSTSLTEHLLLGAATPRGVMAAFHEILGRTARTPHLTGYVGFYAGALTAGPESLAPALDIALSVPFFRHDTAVQMAEVTALLKGWRQWSTEESPLAPAYRHDFDRVVGRLIRGKARPQGDTPYIWAPIEMLRAEEGLRPTRPGNFLKVAGWFLGLQSLYRETELAALFRLRGMLGDAP